MQSEMHFLLLLGIDTEVGDFGRTLKTLSKQCKMAFDWKLFASLSLCSTIPSVRPIGRMELGREEASGRE